MFLRYLGGFVPLACIVAISGKSYSVYISKQPFSHFIRAIFGCYGGAGIVCASAKMPVIDATTFSLLYVVFVIPLGVMFLGERIQKSQWAAIIGYVVFNGIPTAGVALGALLIAIGGVLQAALKPSPTTDGPPKISVLSIRGACTGQPGASGEK